MKLRFLKKKFHDMWCERPNDGWHKYQCLLDAIVRLGLVHKMDILVEAMPDFDMYENEEKDCWCEQCTMYLPPHAIVARVRADENAEEEYYRVEL